MLGLKPMEWLLVIVVFAILSILRAVKRDLDRGRH